MFVEQKIVISVIFATKEIGISVTEYAHKARAHGRLLGIFVPFELTYPFKSTYRHTSKIRSTSLR